MTLTGCCTPSLETAAQPTSDDAFDFARHIRGIAPGWWESVLRSALQNLQPKEWDVLWNGGYSRWTGSKAFIQAVDDAPPCEECAAECAKLLQHRAAAAGTPDATSDAADATRPLGDLLATVETGGALLSSDMRDTSRAGQVFPGAGFQHTTDPSARAVTLWRRVADIYAFIRGARGSRSQRIPQDDMELESGQHAVPFVALAPSGRLIDADPVSADNLKL